MLTQTRSIILAGSTGLLLLAAPASSYAGFFDWLFHRETIVAAPAVAGNPCAPTVAYAARTSYRLGFVNVPVTSVQPVSTCDPCTGTAVTAYRPTTSYVRRLRFVPTTTYRPVSVAATAAPAYTAAYAASPCATGNCGTVSAGGCATGNCAAPATYYTPSTAGYAPATPGCCGAGGARTLSHSAAPAATYTPVPSVNYAQPSTTYSQPSTLQPSTTYAPPAGSSAQPTPAEPPSTAEPRTFMREELNGSQQQPVQPAPEQETPEPQLQPIPDATIQKSGSGIFRAPRLVDPQDQSAQRTPAWQVQTAVHVEPAQLSQEEIDAQGWRAAR